MMTTLGLHQTVPSHSQPCKLAATGRHFGLNADALAIVEMPLKPNRPVAAAPKKRNQPKPSKIGRWFGDLFHGRLAQEKKLQVLETVSLGEKRFVTLLRVEGRKLLIGGSSSNVSLLASLDVAANPARHEFRDEIVSLLASLDDATDPVAIRGFRNEMGRVQ